MFGASDYVDVDSTVGIGAVAVAMRCVGDALLD